MIDIPRIATDAEALAKEINEIIALVRELAQYLIDNPSILAALDEPEYGWMA